MEKIGKRRKEEHSSSDDEPEPKRKAVNSTDKPATFAIREIKGNLFTTEDDAIAHCVSRDLHMGKGIATEFKRRYKRVEELKAQNKGIGDVAYLTLNQSPKYIFYLITKDRYFHKPTYNSLRQSLAAMKLIVLELGIQTLSVPLLGCGLDGLKWKNLPTDKTECVYNIIADLFSDCPLTITVYSL